MTTTFNFRPVTATPTDTTAGRLLKVGDFGLGGALSTTSDFPVGGEGSLFFRSTGISGTPFATAALGLQIQSIVDNRSAQIAFQDANNTILRIAARKRNTDGQFGDWRQLYHQASILGTVSQSGGVPTGAIIERGSNANGHYVKFADGTIAVWCSTVTENVNTAVGQIFETGVKDSVSPVAFSTTQQSGNISLSNTATLRWCSAQLLNTTTVRWRGLSPTSVTSQDFTPAIIGRWF